MSNALPARIMIAKPGLDGHDRGAVVVVQGLRDAGFDVIYTGLRRTAKEIVTAAAQEDVDVLGLSVLSGAHITVLSAVLEDLKNIAWRPSVLLAGGIIPPKDADKLKEMGFDLIFGPGTALNDVSDSIAALVAQRSEREQRSDVAWVRTAQQLTSMELGSTELDAQTGGRIVVISGQGGVGKSTLIGELIIAAQIENKSLAIIANDPCGAHVRGAILADRLRMPMDKAAEQCLIRSMPVKDPGKSIAEQSEVMARCLAQQYDLVIVESLGLGQHQYLEAAWADLTIAAVAPGTGDHWQLRKSAALDTCDMVIITKSDLPQFEQLKNDVEDVLHDKRSDKMPPIHCVSTADKQSTRTVFEQLL